MTLSEIFDKEKAIADFEKEKQSYSSNHDTETSVADMIITRYELGKISYEQAAKELNDNDLDVWMIELNAAKSLKEPAKTAH